MGEQIIDIKDLMNKLHEHGYFSNSSTVRPSDGNTLSCCKSSTNIKADEPKYRLSDLIDTKEELAEAYEDLIATQVELEDTQDELEAVQNELDIVQEELDTARDEISSNENEFYAIEWENLELETAKVDIKSKQWALEFAEIHSSKTLTLDEIISNAKVILDFIREY